MARRTRLLVAGVPQHIVQRGNNRQATFFAEEDCRNYLDWLHEAARQYDCQELKKECVPNGILNERCFASLVHVRTIEK